MASENLGGRQEESPINDQRGVSPCSLCLPHDVSAALETNGREKSEQRVKVSGAQRESGRSCSGRRNPYSKADFYVFPAHLQPEGSGRVPGEVEDMESVKAGGGRWSGKGGGSPGGGSALPLPDAFAPGHVRWAL